MEPLSLLTQSALRLSRHKPKPSTFSSLLRNSGAARPICSLRPLPRPQPLQPATHSQLDHRIQLRLSKRHNSTLSVPEPQQQQPPTDLTPSYRLTFTCMPCSHRSSHRVSKQGYHHGTVLVTCPSCKNRHVIADHLKVFLDKKSTLEDILADANVDGKPLSSLLKKGQLGMRQGSMVGNEGEEDIEFWEDGTETVHQKEEK